MSEPEERQRIAGQVQPRRSMPELVDALEELATDYHEALYRAQGHQATTPAARVLVVEPGQVLLVWMPAHTNRHDVALFQNFIDQQAAKRGIQLPIVVVLAEDVTAGPAPQEGDV